MSPKNRRYLWHNYNRSRTSGKLLADALANTRKNKQKIYKLKTRNLKFKLLLKSAKRIFLFSPITRNIILKSGFQRIIPFHK